MRVSRQEKEMSHARIVASASRLLRGRGLHGTSVGDVMEAAGMTHGGFYKHFSSKDALAQAALDAVFAEFITVLDQGDPAAAVDLYRARYLSDEHIEHPELGCPMAAIGTEAARASDRLKASFGAGVRAIVARFARAFRGTPKMREAAAYREFSMMVGAVVIARACDPVTAGNVMAAVRSETLRGR
jgi:TetR/AcrR family transcriptional repressor of nem operon